MNTATVNSVVVIAAMLVCIALLASPRLAKRRLWRATITPLASIIGSGFLVLGPILGRNFGNHAVFVMAGLCLTAYALGGAIRYSIGRIDALGHEGKMPTAAAKLNTASSWALTFAYVISVTYYLNLFGSFAVAMTPQNDEFTGRLVTSAVLLFIAYFGWRHGLALLERLEQGAASLNLTIIGGLLVGLALYAFELTRRGALPANPAPEWRWDSLFLVFGLVIVVQGFETSRYLQAEYDAATRIRSMRYAQWVSSTIYIVFIGLLSLTFAGGDIGSEQTALISVTQVVAPVLPAFLVVTALAAQFSAAVADTSGSGGLAEELSHQRIQPHQAYALVALSGLALTWTADIYQIISYASRAFALYYALQCGVATALALEHDGPRRPLRVAGFAVLTVAAAAMAALGVPAEG